MGQVAEGVKTARPVMQLAAEHDVFMPIAAEVDAVVNEGRTPREAYRGLGRATAQSRAPRGRLMATTAARPTEPVLRAEDRPLDWGREREMNALEALMWRAEEDPRLRSTICGLEELDTAPDWDRFLAAHEWATRLVPRFRQRVVEPLGGIGAPAWVTDPGLRPALPRAARAAARGRRLGGPAARRPSRSR